MVDSNSSVCCTLAMTKSEAIHLFGSKARLARALGVSRSAVSQWKEERIPGAHALRIRYELCHDKAKEKLRN